MTSSPSSGHDGERLRQALIDAAQRAYEDARISGLCAEGAWEVALDAMRTLDLATLTDSRRSPAPDPGADKPGGR